MRTGSLSEQRDVREFDRSLLLQLYRRFRRRRLREAAHYHLHYGSLTLLANSYTVRLALME